MKILVIEDAKDLRDDIVEMLRLEGYEALGAEDGLVGVELAKKHHPDLIICDIMMPNLDGYGVLETLHDEPQTATIPFIFLTAKTEREDMRQGMVLGADDYITKPFPVTELLDSVESQLRKREELNEAANQRMEELRKNIMTALPHELRTPLNTIIGFSDMLVSESQYLKPDQVADWGASINQSAHRLYRLVENYLYYVRLEVALQSPKENDDDVSPLHDFHSIVEGQAIRLANKYERYDDLELDVAAPPTLRIGYQDATKVVSELVDNAFKFSESGQTVRVTGNVRDDGDYELIIENQGRGFTEEQVQHIGAYMQFERWLYEQQGMGLGLAIVNLLMQLYDGEFHIDISQESGARVSVVLEAY